MSFEDDDDINSHQDDSGGFRAIHFVQVYIRSETAMGGDFAIWGRMGGGGCNVRHNLTHFFFIQKMDKTSIKLKTHQSNVVVLLVRTSNM